MRLCTSIADHRTGRTRLCRLIDLGLTVTALLLLATHPCPAAVNRSEYLPVNGEKLYLLIRGADQQLPVLLWVHGGPGGAERPLFRFFNEQLEKNFTVVYWDQRGAGRSYDPKEDPRQLTISRHLADLDAVVDHLSSTLPSTRIFLVGHSWGAALSLLYAGAHAHKISGVVAVNPLISARDQRWAEYNFVLGEAERRHDAKAIQAAAKIGPPPYQNAHQVLALEKLSGKYGGVFHRSPSRLWIMLRALVRGLVWPWEIPKYVKANRVSLQAMHQELLNLDLSRSLHMVDVPVLFFLGRYDRHADAAFASAYFEELHAPRKRLIWFENSAHNIPFEEPKLFNVTLTRELQSIFGGDQ